jgi:hypothetical protein
MYGVPRLVGTGGVELLVSLTLSMFVYVSKELNNHIFRTDTVLSLPGIVRLTFGTSGACGHVHLFSEVLYSISGYFGLCRSCPNY